VLLLGDRGGNENAEMPDLFVHHVYNALSAHADLMFIEIGVGDPVQRLLRRRNVVTPACEDDDRRADGLEVERAPGLQLRRAPRQFVADEYLFDDPADLGFIHVVEAAPPALEFEEAIAAAFGVGEEV